MKLNANKATKGKRPDRVPTPDELANDTANNFDDLAATILASGAEGGAEIVAAQRERMNAAECAPCGRTAATATLSAWIRNMNITRMELTVQRVIIPLELKNKPFDALYDAIMATGDEHGIALAQASRTTIESASCHACARHRVAASLRVWLARHQQEAPT